MAEIRIARSDQGGVIEADPGDVIVVQLEENPSTGYQWIELPLEGAALAQLSSEFEQEPGVLLGRGGMRTLRYVALAPGQGWIRLRLRRMWDPENVAIDHFVVTIAVR